MSHSSNLLGFYGNFFRKSTIFAVSPYPIAFRAAAGDREEYGAGFVACGILTFIVPVLPLITLGTTTLAIIALLVAAASALVTFPGALILDMFSNSNSVADVVSDMWNA